MKLCTSHLNNDSLRRGITIMKSKTMTKEEMIPNKSDIGASDVSNNLPTRLYYSTKQFFTKHQNKITWIIVELLLIVFIAYVNGSIQLFK